MCEKELDYALGYFTIFPGGFKNDNAVGDPYLFISDDCPKELRERLLHDWPIIKKKTLEKHANGEWSSTDAF